MGGLPPFCNGLFGGLFRRTFLRTLPDCLSAGEAFILFYFKFFKLARIPRVRTQVTAFNFVPRGCLSRFNNEKKKNR